jgi:hypothetical protein
MPKGGRPPAGGGEEDVASMAISGETCPYAGDLSGGEEGAVSMAISGEPGPEEGEPTPTWPPPFASSFACSGSPFSNPACGSDSSILRGSSASEISSVASPKDKAAFSLRFRSKKTKNRRKKGDGAGNSVRPPQVMLHQHTLFKHLHFGFVSSLLRGADALYYRMNSIQTRTFTQV